MVIQGSRAELTDVDGVEVQSPGGMWVPTANVHPGISSHRGLTLVEISRGGSASIRVDWVEPGSRADEIGLRVGDVITRIEGYATDLVGNHLHDVRRSLDSAGSFSARRGDQILTLVNECSVPQRDRRRGYRCCPL